MNNFRATLPLKILALILAIIVWVTIKNMINPIQRGFVEVPIAIENEDVITKQNKTYKILDSKMCRITYLINKDQHASVRQNDFKVYVDLDDMNENGEVSVIYNTLNDVDKYISNVDVTPDILHVSVSDAISKELKVKYIIKGDNNDEHIIGSVILSPNVVYASGSDELINNISHLSIDIPLKRNEESFSGEATPKIISNDGNEMNPEGITLGATSVKYSVVRFAKSVITLNAVVEGKVKSGYSYAGAQVYPNNITVYGPKSILDKLSIVDLPTINIDGMTENTEITYTMEQIIPTGIKCYDTEAVKVNININNNILNNIMIPGNIGPSAFIEESEESLDNIDEKAEQ